MKKKLQLEFPNDRSAAEQKVLLHSCCAPCSSAILELLLQENIMPTVFYSNSNIYPKEEYLHRRNEIEEHLKKLGVPFVEDEYDYEAWLDYVKGLEREPERGNRCLMCFKYRLARAASYAEENGFTLFTTTLASSRWKRLDQIDEAGQWAQQQFASRQECPMFWPQNWRKGGLQERRNELLKLYNFYNQQYCGCEFSIRNEDDK